MMLSKRAMRVSKFDLMYESVRVKININDLVRKKSNLITLDYKINYDELLGKGFLIANYFKIISKFKHLIIYKELMVKFISVTIKEAIY